MTPADFVAKRSADWAELEALLARVNVRRDRGLDSQELLRFAKLYRSACTDLSLAHAFRLSRDLEQRLEDLVARGHANLYTFRRNRWSDVREFFFRKVPYLVFTDKYVWICQVAFYLPFALCLYMSYQSPRFAERVVSAGQLQQAVEMHSNDKKAPTTGDAVVGTSFYIYNNVSIDLLVFGFGALGGVGSILLTLFNAVYLGCVIGFVLNSPSGANLLHFITAHAPFELTAIGISAGAGLRIGLAFVAPAGRRRLRALADEARFAVPVITAAALLTALAAVIEAVLGPAPLPLSLKMMVAGVCTLFMFVYFGVGGYVLQRRGYQPDARKSMAIVAGAAEAPKVQGV